MLPSAKDRLATRLVLALAFFAFAFVFPYVGAVNNPNENVRTYMTMSLVEEHTFKIDKIVERHGWVNDMAKVPDKRTGESHLYSVKAPAVSYAGVPFYWAFTKLGPHFGIERPTVASAPEVKQAWLRASTLVLRLFVVQLPCFLFLVWFERFLRAYTRDTVLRLSAVVAAGLGTNYLGYALMFASHAPFAWAAFGSFGIITRERARFPDDPRRRRLSMAFLAGLLAGLATLLEYHAFPVSGALALYALTTFWRPTRLALFGLGAVLNAGALMFFQWRAFGSPLTPGHRMSENPAFAALLNKGLFGIGKPSAEVLVDLSVNPGFGFFGMSPFMWLGVLAVPVAIFAARGAPFQCAQQRTAIFGLAFTMFLLWLTVSAAINWRGGWTIGPRYLGAAPPFFAFAAVYVLGRLDGSAASRALGRGAASGLAIASVAQAGLAGMLFNTIPESVTRPLPQLVIPTVKAGLVPHHVGELVGLPGRGVWLAIAGAALLAAIVPALLPMRDGALEYVGRLALVVAFAALGLRPAFSEPKPAEGGDAGLETRRMLMNVWEPPGRDLITELRAKAPRDPCAWFRVADLERAMGRGTEADQDERRAQRDRSRCR
jgi:hypothetical protein